MAPSLALLRSMLQGRKETVPLRSGGTIGGPEPDRPAPPSRPFPRVPECQPTEPLASAIQYSTASSPLPAAGVPPLAGALNTYVRGSGQREEVIVYRRTLALSSTQRAELIHLQDHDPRPYLRERAAALLKIAAGQAPYAVARHGLHKPRHPDTVYRWEPVPAARRDRGVSSPAATGASPHARRRAAGVAAPAPRTARDQAAPLAPARPAPGGAVAAAPPPGAVPAPAAPARWKRGRLRVHSPDRAYATTLAWSTGHQQARAQPDAGPTYGDEFSLSTDPQRHLCGRRYRAHGTPVAPRQ